MAIAHFKPDTESPIQVTTPDMIKAPAKSTMTALVPESRIKSLLKYVEGYPWTVNYYGQLLNVNNTLDHFDPNLVNMAQSYYEIRNAVLQVSSPLSSSYDEESSVTKVNGSAIIPMGVKTNVGDLFIAQVDTGEDAIFVINNVSRKTHRKESLYEVSYELYAYISDEPEFYDKLQARLNETYFFNPDTNYFNRDVLIKPSIKEAIDRLKEFQKESMDFYFSTFIQKHTSSLLLPGLNVSVYDPLLADFIARTVDVSTITNGKFYRHTLESTDLQRPSILSNLLTRTLPHPRMSESRYGFCRASALPMRSRLGTLSYTGIDYVLYPLDPIRDHLSPNRGREPEILLLDVKNAGNYDVSLKEIDVTSNNNQVSSKPLLHELLINDSYVVSEGFYNYIADHASFTEVSYIELMIYRFLNREAIAKEDLAVAIQDYKNWSLLHQFYLLPVMWLIIKDSVGGV